MPQTKSDIYTAAIIIIGNEILSGRTKDANTPWMAEKLNVHGIRLNEVRVVPDIESSIIKAVNELRPDFDYVFTTGGIGPTHDDITAESIARAFGVEVECNQEAYQMLSDHSGGKDLNEAQVKMAMIPNGASLIHNPVSAAPGFVLGNVYVMAGVPVIMRAMFDNVLDDLAEGAAMLSSTVSCNLPESTLAPQLSVLQDNYDDVEIGSYPYFKDGSIGLSVVLRSVDAAALKEAVTELAVIIDGLSHGA